MQIFLKEVRVKVMVRSRKVTKWKYCMTVVRHMFYGSFGMQNTMMAFMFRFDTKKGQDKVKLGKKRVIFKIQIFFLKHAYLVQFCLRIPTWLFIFTFIRNAKIAFKVT